MYPKKLTGQQHIQYSFDVATQYRNRRVSTYLRADNWDIQAIQPGLQFFFIFFSITLKTVWKAINLLATTT